ncbi:MAG: phosphoribosylglycinamide formyltransferase [Defluviitaleaceae bacterium]|nr:phosphoribosylglycinamide formyltransferase [Defluviitaleaceae bacterium]
MKNIAIFASGSGSNFEAVATAAISGKINAKVSLLVCDKPEAMVILRAKRLGVPVFVCNSKDFANRAAHEGHILAALKDAGVEFIVLAGYMRIIGKTLLGAYSGKIINIHPSMLPDFPGMDAINAAFSSGASYTGVTVHYIDEGVDTGPIISQRRVEILPDDTLETLEEKVHKVEHELYVNVLVDLFKEAHNENL